MRNRQTNSGDFLSEARRLAPKSLQIQMMLQTFSQNPKVRTRENLERLRLLVDQVKIRVGETTKSDPDQLDDYVGRDENAVPVDGRGRHLTKQARLAEREDLEKFFLGTAEQQIAFGHHEAREAFQVDPDTGELLGKLVKTDDGTWYVEPLSMRELFPEERASKDSLKYVNVDRFK